MTHVLACAKHPTAVCGYSKGRQDKKGGGGGLFSYCEAPGLMLNKMCVVPLTVISCLGLTGEMFPQAQTSSVKLEVDFEEFGGALGLPRS